MMNKYLNRKERIILNAIDIINEHGFKGLSIREIAKKENVTEAAIYKHFSSKNQIIIEVLEYYSKFDFNIIETLKSSNESAKNKIIIFFKMFSEYYNNYPAITSILTSYDVLLYEKTIYLTVIEILKQRSNFLMSLIKEGQASGNIKNDIDFEVLSDILLGSFERIIFKWRLSKFKFSLKQKTMEVISEILKIC